MKIFTPLPGEYVASALKRGNELLGIKSLKLDDYFIRPIPRKWSRFATGEKIEYREYAKFEFPVFFNEKKISDEVLKKYTLYPLTAALGRSRINTIVTPTNWKKICTDCVLEDFETHGTAYIHRRNVQLPVRHCSVHGSELISICPTCLVPVAKHDITKFGLCGRKYKKPIYQSNSLSHRYSKFIAEILNYKGFTFKRDQTNWVVHNSLLVKHKTTNIQYENVIDTIKRELGLHVKNVYFNNLSNDTFAILAFLACETAENYIDLMTSKESTNSLAAEVESMRNAEGRQYNSMR